MKDSMEVKFVDPRKWLSKELAANLILDLSLNLFMNYWPQKKPLTQETLGDFEPYTLVYESTDHQWEKKLKNRISNGSVSPLAVMDRMLKVFTLFTEQNIIINTFDGSTRRELFKHLN